MTKDSSQPHPRRRRPRGSLTPEAILDAAEAIAAREGFGALSMRAVAGRLEAAPMALYNHVATRDALVDGLLDRVLHRFVPEPPTDDWAGDLRRFARAHRRLLSDHPWAVAPLFSQPNPGLGAVMIGEHALGILARGGYQGGRAVAAFSGLIALNYGWSSFTAARDLDVRGATTEVEGILDQLPAELFPRTVSVAGEMGAYGSDHHYDFVLDQFLSGLRLTAAEGAG
jgi:AcrR family transcriptional regulator